MNRTSNYEFWAKIVLLVVHVAGVVGMLSPLRDYFVMLTPINLLISLFILLSFHKERSKKFYLVAIFIMIAGFMIELIGVNTGVPFGDYSYGEPLGPQLLGTPFMIGINWFIMAYCGATLFRNATKYPLLDAIMAGVGITLFDFIMEPVAMHLDFWNWSSTEVPLQNYLTWGICITLFSLLIYNLDFQKKNPISNWVLGVQVLFFAGILIGANLWS